MAKKKAAAKKTRSLSKLGVFQPPSPVPPMSTPVSFPQATLPNFTFPAPALKEEPYVVLGKYDKQSNSIPVTTYPTATPPISVLNFGYVVEHLDNNIVTFLEFSPSDTPLLGSTGRLTLKKPPATVSGLRVTILTKKTPPPQQVVSKKPSKKKSPKKAPLTRKKS